jgi:formylglycine-generating enzyme required for sulfatase activity
LSGEYPVVYVSYDDAQKYIDWLNQKIGTDSYRLPTEAEWEYATRAGTTTRFAQGNDVNSGQANFSGEDSEHILQKTFPDFLSRGFPVPVNELDAANAWGLRHMSGNVFEITRSCYAERYDAWATTSEWLAHSLIKSCDRSVGGGSYANSVDLSWVAWRSRRYEDTQSQFDGFRVVKDLRSE